MVTMQELLEQARLTIFHFYDPNDTIAVENLRYLVESGQSFELGKGRSVLFHRAHIPNTQDHLHFLQKRNELYALNKDGTAHDASHGKQMHRWATDAVKKQFPEFQLPKRGLIESQFEIAEPLLESNSSARVLLDPAIMRVALNRANLYGSP